MSRPPPPQAVRIPAKDLQPGMIIRLDYQAVTVYHRLATHMTVTTEPSLTGNNLLLVGTTYRSTPTHLLIQPYQWVTWVASRPVNRGGIAKFPQDERGLRLPRVQQDLDAERPLGISA